MQSCGSNVEMFSAAYEGDELALIEFNLDEINVAKRVIL